MNAHDDLAQVDAIVAAARVAQQAYEAQGSQDRYDRAAQAAAWAIMEPARNRHLAELAVQTTGLGNVPDKITKNHRKTLGLMRDIAQAKTYGVIRDDAQSGITEIARPIGVIGAVVPSTNPAATPANNIINALKYPRRVRQDRRRQGTRADGAGQRVQGEDPALAGNHGYDCGHGQPEQRQTRLHIRHPCFGRRGGQCHCYC